VHRLSQPRLPLKFHAEELFIAAHSSTLAQMATIDTVASWISSAERLNKTIPDKTLDDWAQDNSKAVRTLRENLLDSTSGAIPLMLNLFSVQYPTTGGPQVRGDIVAYVDGVRAMLGLALLNQAWLEVAYSHNKVYSKNIQDSSIRIVHQAYEWIGASYPTPAHQPSQFLHRVGTSAALVGLNRPTLPGERGQVLVTQSRSDVDWLLTQLTYPRKNAWKSLTIQDYMKAEELNFVFEDPASVRRVIAKERFDGTRWEVRSEAISIAGNEKAISTVVHYSEVCNIFKCSVSKKESALRDKLWETQFMYHRNEVETNNWGMPALMDPELIVQERDGIIVYDRSSETAIDGTRVISLWISNEYQTSYDYRAVDTATSEQVISFSGSSSNILGTVTDSDAVILQAGYQTNMGFVVRQSVMVADLFEGSKAVQMVLHIDN